MSDFKPEDLQEPERRPTDYFDFGIHKVKFLGFEYGTTEKGTEFIEAVVVDPENDAREDKVRVWFTDKSNIFSIDNFRQIILLNTPEEKHAAAKEAILKCKNPEELCDLLNKKMIGKDAWFTKYYDSERTYTDKKGEVRRSVNRSVLGYEPKLKEALMPQQAKGKQMSQADVLETFGPAVNEPPFNDDGSEPVKADDKGWA